MVGRLKKPGRVTGPRGDPKTGEEELFQDEGEKDFNLPSCKFLREATTSFMEELPRDRAIGDIGGDESARGLMGGEPDPDQNDSVFVLEGESAEFATLIWSGEWAKKQTRRRQPDPSLHG